MRPAISCACIVAMAAGVVACSRAPSAPRHVVLVSIDTLRADRLGTYGYGQPTSPSIDALATGSTVFESAVATCPATAPSLASILTGTHRANHRVFGNGWTLPADVETIAEILKTHGYRTIARMTNPAIDPSAGFAQGFDDFASPPGLEPSGPGMLEGEPLVADVERIVASLDATPVFLWLHFMDTHGPYFPPDAYRQRFAPDAYRWTGDPPALPVGAGNFGLELIPRYQAVGEERTPAVYRARYDAEVRYVDDHVAAVVRALERRGLWDDTLFIFTADHGESLGEHGYYFAHGWFVYDDQIRVPLVLRGPGVPSGHRIRQSVSLVDVAPTILDLLGLPPSATMEGRSLRPLLDGSAPDREAFAQSYYGEGLVAYRLAGMKYVFKPPRTGSRAPSDPPFPDAGQEWLFDVDRDPGETSNLAETREDTVAAMRARVQAWLDDQNRRGRGRTAENPRGGHAPTRVLGDPQLERQLRALGYLD